MEYPGYTEELYYDRAGNRRRRVLAGVEESYKYDPANHLTEYTKGGVKTTYTYDNAGNLTADDRAATLTICSTGQRRWRPSTAMCR